MSYNISSDHGDSMIKDLHEGWREAIALATERQAIIDAMIRDKTIAEKKRDDDAKSMRSLIDGIYEASLLLANEVSSRQAINDSTTYKTTTTTATAIPSSSIHDTNATLSVILQRLNSVISIVSTQDIKMTVSKDEVKRLHGLFVSEKKAREEMKQREDEEEVRQREKENTQQLQQHQQQQQQQQQQFLPLHSLNCERIIEEETSVITEDTTNNSTTKKKVAKKKVIKK